MLPPPPPQAIQPNLFHPACTWEMIVLMLSVRSSLKALHNLRIIQRSQREIATTKGKFPLKVANTSFDFTLLFFYWGQQTAKGFGQHTIFGYSGYYMFGYDLKYHWYLIFKLWEWLWEPQGEMCLIYCLVMFIFVKEIKGSYKGSHPLVIIY